MCSLEKERGKSQKAPTPNSHATIPSPFLPPFGICDLELAHKSCGVWDSKASSQPCGIQQLQPPIKSPASPLE